MTMDMWDQITGDLCAKGFSVLRYDMFGHGRSSCDPCIQYELSTFVQQLQQLVNAVLPPNESFCLVGFSMGGLVSLEFASSFPDQHRIQSLLLLDSCGLQGKVNPNLRKCSPHSSSELYWGVRC